MIQVVLCTISACDSLVDKVKVEGCWAGILSIVAIIQDVLALAEAGG